MKETYSTPEMKVVPFDCEDVITTSGLGGGIFELPVSPASEDEWN